MSSTSLRVFVHFKQDTVFAGESVECVVTFKNVETIRTRARPRVSPRQTNANIKSASNPLDKLRAARGRSQSTAARKNSVSGSAQFPNAPRASAHLRTQSSFSVVESATKQPSPELPGGGFHIANTAPERNHTRTVSIISLAGPTSQQRPIQKHVRSASVQLSTDGRVLGRGRPSIIGHRSVTMGNSQSSSPLTPSPLSESLPSTPADSNTTVRLQSPQLPRSRASRQSLNGKRASPAQNTFQFPPVSAPSILQPGASPDAESRPPLMSTDTSSSARSYFGSSVNGQTSMVEQAPTGTPLTRVFSVRSMDGTPRNSIDLYSTSNHSNETLMSELPSLPKMGFVETPQLSRRSSLAGRPPIRRSHEALLMGYAQLSGSFTLDGSLVNQAPFEEVKRKAVVGGQGGGGVVGVNRPTNDGSIWGSFNWNSIGESLGGMIGGSAPSSIKEMKSIAGSNSIPLLSTSKSILFVDLNLAPGESRSFSYQFTLPRGLPPTHKGRAIKVAYNLVIGTHRAGARSDQPHAIKQVEIPFRVLSGVNGHGEHLGHDLMSPYIILQDQARTKSIHVDADAAVALAQQLKPDQPANTTSSVDFQSYVDHLLSRPRRNSSRSLLSPTAETIPATPRTPTSPTTPRSRQLSRLPNGPLPAASILIDEAIRQSTNASSAIYSPTNFTIARSSIPIATLTISRPALKLGDTLTCVIDFSNAKLSCYALEVTLESSEKVDQALAIRSPQSVERATRRVWASAVENTMWTRRCVFRAQVPFHATPAFCTSGVNLEWCVRLELVVGIARQQATPDAEDALGQEQSGETDAGTAERVLEVLNADERGTVLAAKQYLPCESFEVEIPIRVFGAIVTKPDVEVEAEGLHV